YPPEPLSQSVVDGVIKRFCEDVSPTRVEEAGCAVCGELHLISEMQLRKHFQNHFNHLAVPGISRKERLTEEDPIQELEGAIIDNDCDYVCSTCREALYKGKIPKLSMANGLWIGKVPPVLQDLTLFEKLLIAKIRLNCCYVRVSSGFSKMICHAVAFEAPVPRVY
ncbi:hypothetical protein BDN72DRAFT_746894, partial [Pluteus cervinus]